jgi:biopolymer transport protein ExbD
MGQGVEMRLLRSTSGNGKKGRVVRNKFEELAELNMASLIDILTVILMFLIKNAQVGSAINIPQNMSVPTTITNEQLYKNSSTVIVKLYTDKVLYGTENLYVGSIKDLQENAKTRQTIYEFMKRESETIAKLGKQKHIDLTPCLLIQADKRLPCQYITTMVKIGAGAAFSNIYFSTIQDESWLKKSATVDY